jgi:hypothetical protein
LIGVGQALLVPDRLRVLGREPSHDGQRLIRRQPIQRVAGVGVHHLPGSAGLKAIDGAAAAHGDAQPRRGREAGTRGRIRGRHGDRGDIQRFHAEEALFGRERRHPDINEDYARHEPHDEHRGEHDARPSMRINERLAPVEQLS